MLASVLPFDVGFFAAGLAASPDAVFAGDGIGFPVAGRVFRVDLPLNAPAFTTVVLNLPGQFDLERLADGTLLSSGSERHEAREVSDDMYASIDKMIGKLERQIRGAKSVARSKKRRSKLPRGAVSAKKTTTKKRKKSARSRST